MIRYSIKLIFLICFLWVGYTLAGCSDSEHKQRDEYFVKVVDRTITVSDFNKAFKIAKNAYPQNRIQRPDVAQEVRLRLIQQMIEEMTLLERAEELGITMTDSQVEKALKDIKRDYPDNVFQEILLEYAIPYQSWREGLKTRLLMEKVIAQELGDKIEITHDDISKYYEEHFEADDTPPDVNEVSKDTNNIIIKILRKEKIEKAYTSWIKKLKKKYAVEINKKELEKMTGL
ncbi:MAG: SurA N-terminal domain-containing protein [Desulfobacteraceae bacterium]|nr:SurA N-terminal domain-containing protein [Desulfobacteraceae bacterium]MDH3574379.1 SurA N-terminal domain-containing protein [Desulfobacteraceae bacterium]MDH3722128.1 SurA N-terminal domain-containing protein [Desulfobacteraceae bacterium]MDH3837080.1 SurA N-terminal domain-containing protein [Desulfobacteraceae bacterium]MDH3874439.1 SurA N-terminal domain-containing protein [Desulfobacteraceae bacterium]